MSRKEDALIPQEIALIDEAALFKRVSVIIENRKSRAGAYANLEITLMYWEVGQHIGSMALDGGRAGYGKQIVVTLSRQLEAR